MKICEVEVYTLRFTYPVEERFEFAGGLCTGRLTSIVRVKTDDGLEGVGSTYSHPQLVRTIIQDHLAPFLMGKNPLEIQNLWKQNQRLTQWYGRKGAPLSALGAIDIALWDIAGKAKGVPVSKLLGAVTDRVPVYASGLLWRDDLHELREVAQQYLDLGFRAMKMRLGKNYSYDIEAVQQVRDVIGPDRRLMVDGNARYSLEGAKRVTPVFDELNVFWFEEPFQPDNLADFRELRRHTKTPLAAGENEFGLQGFEALVTNEAVDILQPDTCRTGGITEGVRIAKMAEDNGLKIAPHTWNDAVALAANLHFAASCKNALTVEMDQTGNRFLNELLRTKLVVEDGFLRVPTEPGLGIELDEDVLQRYAIDPNLPIPGGNYCDMVFGVSHYRETTPYPDARAEVSLK